MRRCASPRRLAPGSDAVPCTSAWISVRFRRAGRRFRGGRVASCMSGGTQWVKVCALEGNGQSQQPENHRDPGRTVIFSRNVKHNAKYVRPDRVTSPDLPHWRHVQRYAAGSRMAWNRLRSALHSAGKIPSAECYVEQGHTSGIQIASIR